MESMKEFRLYTATMSSTEFHVRFMGENMES